MAIRGNSAKPLLRSKKFWAFIITIVSLDVLIGVGMVKWLPLDQWSTIVLLSLVVVLGVVATGYIIGQAGLDALTHLFDVITPDSVFGKREDPPQKPAPRAPPTTDPVRPRREAPVMREGPR